MEKRRVYLIAVLAALPFLIYGFSLTLPFMCDDFNNLAEISGNSYRAQPKRFSLCEVVTPEESRTMVEEHPSVGPWCMSPGLKIRWLRPFYSVVVNLNYLIWKRNAFGHHLSNLLVHALSCILLFLIGERLFHEARSAFFGAVIFSVHSCGAFSIPWSAGMVDLLPVACGLGGLYAHIRHRERGTVYWEVLAWVLFILAFLSRELGAITVGAYFLYDALVWRKESRERWPGLYPLLGYYTLFSIPLLVFIVYFVLNGYGVTGQYSILGGKHPVGAITAYVLKNLMLYAACLLFFVPIFHQLNLLLFHSLVPTVFVLGLLVLTIALFLPGFRKGVFKHPSQAFLAAWMVLSLLPTLPVLTQIRHLYPAVAPLALLLGHYVVSIKKVKGFGRYTNPLVYAWAAYLCITPLILLQLGKGTLRSLHTFQRDMVTQTRAQIDGMPPPVNVFFINLPSAVHLFFLQNAFDFYTEKGLTRIFPLTVSKRLPEVTVLGDRSLLIRTLGKPFLESDFERLYLTEPINREGLVRSNAFFTATIEEVEDGHVLGIRFDFTRRADDGSCKLFFIEDGQVLPTGWSPGFRGRLSLAGDSGR